MWLRRNHREIEELVVWINENDGRDVFVPVRVDGGKEVAMFPERKECFGLFGDKHYWKEYLLRHGINPSRFLKKEKTDSCVVLRRK